MLKIEPRVLPAWAWVSIIVTPFLLLAPLLWFVMNEAIGKSAVLNVFGKALEARMLTQQDSQSLIDSVFNASPMMILMTGITVVVAMSFAIIFAAKRQSQVIRQAA